VPSWNSLKVSCEHPRAGPAANKPPFFSLSFSPHKNSRGFSSFFFFSFLRQNAELRVKVWTEFVSPFLWCSNETFLSSFPQDRGNLVGERMRNPFPYLVRTLFRFLLSFFFSPWNHVRRSRRSRVLTPVSITFALIDFAARDNRGYFFFSLIHSGLFIFSLCVFARTLFGAGRLLFPPFCETEIHFPLFPSSFDATDCSHPSPQDQEPRPLPNVTFSNCKAVYSFPTGKLQFAGARLPPSPLPPPLPLLYE